MADGRRSAVLAVRYGRRVTSYGEMYLNYPLYGEPDADLDIAYYFWVIRRGRRVTLVDTGFAPAAATGAAGRTTRPPRRRCPRSASTRPTSPRS